jgi:tryptophan-rich sensory protein
MMRTGGIFLKKKTKTLLTALAVPLGVGAVSGFLTQGSMDTFEKLKQPPLTPPGWVFPVVWTGLFAMMGTASYLEKQSTVLVWSAACSKFPVAGIFL